MPASNAICLFVAGVLRATLPTTEFSVEWNHSVEKTRWEERYRIDGTRLRLVEARIQGSGAGMDPPPGARLHGGWWSWQPSLAPLPEIRLTLSPFARDYDLCWRERCRTLHALVTQPASGQHSRPHGNRMSRDATAVVDIRPCTGKSDE